MSFPTNSVRGTLPTSLLDLINQAYFLHLLATDEEKVIPPGKSLLTTLSKPRKVQHELSPDLQRKVEVIVHKAFWDEALEQLSSGEAVKQISRLRLLYADLFNGIRPLVPQSHPILLTLTSPLPPTSSPLLTALDQLGELLRVLKSRCAPVRDKSIDGMLSELQGQNLVDLAPLVIRAVRFTLSLADDMKDDLSEIVLGSMSEDQLRAVVRDQAKDMERKAVHELWGSNEVIGQEWKRWMSTAEGDRGPWTRRLVSALTSPLPVSCSLPNSTLSSLLAPSSSGSSSASNQKTEREFPLEDQSVLTVEQVPSNSGSLLSSAAPDLPVNILPPQLLFVAPELLRLQNTLQALVITASLNSLIVQPPAHSKIRYTDRNSTVHPAEDFTARVWSLLEAEVNEGDDTKLVNLADEVIRSHRLTSGQDKTNSERDAEIDTDQENRLRAAVERILRVRDPVFVLLQNRLTDALVKILSDPVGRSETHGLLPTKLRSGGDLRNRSEQFRLRDDDVKAALGSNVFVEPVPRDYNVRVMGFEDPVLRGRFLEVVTKIDLVIKWVSYVWDFGCGSL